MTRAATRLNLRPIVLRQAQDGRGAFDGSYQLVSDGHLFSVARWNGVHFVYPSGDPVEFVPSHLHVPAEVRFDG